MARGFAQCGLSVDHERHPIEIDGMIVMCDGKVEK